MSGTQPKQSPTSANDVSSKADTQDNSSNVQEFVDPFEDILQQQQQQHQQQHLLYPVVNNSIQQQQQMQTQTNLWNDDLQTPTADQYRQLPPLPPQSLNMNQTFMNSFFPAQTNNSAYDLDEEQDTMQKPENLIEDEITTFEDSTDIAPSDNKEEGTMSDKNKPSNNEDLEITITPEYRVESFQEKFPFYVRVNLIFNPVSRQDITSTKTTGIDVICVLDNSGSMAGSKIDNLKRAMEFVISTLSEKDRLAVVTFNYSGTPIQGLWLMNEDRKTASRQLIQMITAGGGTDIYDGMKEGWKILKHRKTKNPSSCMFLLTDGQDPDHLEEKKDLTATMRQEGTSLFVFGFGNDHDSAHLTAIANAGEGSFIYVETNDTVIDAFGGAIGSQQGQMLRDIKLTINTIEMSSLGLEASSQGIMIEEILSGHYHSNLKSDKKEGNVDFADLYGGEKRDFLVKLRLPAIVRTLAAAGEGKSERTSPVLGVDEFDVAPGMDTIDHYPLLSVLAHYKQYGNEEELITKAVICSISRYSQSKFNAMIKTAESSINSSFIKDPVDSHPYQRDPEVDCQIQRLDCTMAMKEAMKEADAGQFQEAKDRIQNMKNSINCSISFHKGNVLTVGLVEDLNEMERKIGSKEAYERDGGRAAMEETTNMYSKQRAVYSKNANALQMQSMSSTISQSAAFDFKSSTNNTSKK
jgi:Mg-chelatase subunit ChlD